MTGETRFAKRQGRDEGHELVLIGRLGALATQVVQRTSPMRFMRRREQRKT
jgi:hypothetical protein